MSKSHVWEFMNHAQIPKQICQTLLEEPSGFSSIVVEYVIILKNCTHNVLDVI